MGAPLESLGGGGGGYPTPVSLKTVARNILVGKKVLSKTLLPIIDILFVAVFSYNESLQSYTPCILTRFSLSGVFRSSENKMSN